MIEIQPVLPFLVASEWEGLGVGDKVNLCLNGLEGIYPAAVYAIDDRMMSGRKILFVVYGVETNYYHLVHARDVDKVQMGLKEVQNPCYWISKSVYVGNDEYFDIKGIDVNYEYTLMGWRMS